MLIWYDTGIQQPAIEHVAGVRVLKVVQINDAGIWQRTAREAFPECSEGGRKQNTLGRLLQSRAILKPGSLQEGHTATVERCHRRRCAHGQP